VSGDLPWYKSYDSIQVDAYCGSALGATCAGHGSCSGSGYGAYGTGDCIVTTSADSGWTAACAANACTIQGPDLDQVKALIERIGIIPPGGSQVSIPSAQDSSTTPCGSSVSMQAMDDGTVVGTACGAAGCIPVDVACQQVAGLLICRA
jgi:hypothetical protein